MPNARASQFLHPANVVMWVVAALLIPAEFAVADESEYIDAGRGDVRVVRPSDFDPAEPLPVVILLHAFGYSASFEESYLQFSAHVDSHRFILGIPDGSRNLTFQRYWNATDACCDIFGQGPDDSGYLRELIDVMSDVYEVDPRRIHLVGHSNGGFMAHRMICDHPGLIAGIATLASATFNDPDACVLGEPVHVLQAHGTIDPVILYGGGCLVGGCYPSASLTQRYVADDNGCGRTPDETPEPLDSHRIDSGGRDDGVGICDVMQSRRGGRTVDHSGRRSQPALRNHVLPTRRGVVSRSAETGRAGRSERRWAG